MEKFSSKHLVLNESELYLSWFCFRLVGADGTCSYIHRMQHTADHTELRDLARAIGAEYVPQPSRRGSAVSDGRKSTDGRKSVEERKNSLARLEMTAQSQVQSATA